jgi:ankyrin repeat protein
MPLSFGTAHLLSAASHGDVETISLLIKNAGLDVRFFSRQKTWPLFRVFLLSFDRLLQKNVHDFDRRGALHRSALNARLLAVSYLLGIASDPNAKDRWGYTPLDLALQGGTLYHM